MYLFFKAIDILPRVGECVKQFEPQQGVVGAVCGVSVAQVVEHYGAHELQVVRLPLRHAAQERQCRVPRLGVAVV